MAFTADAAKGVFGDVLRGMTRLQAQLNLDALRESQDRAQEAAGPAGLLGKNIPVSGSDGKLKADSTPSFQRAGQREGQSEAHLGVLNTGGSTGKVEDAFSDAERTLLQDMREAGLDVDEPAFRRCSMQVAAESDLRSVGKPRGMPENSQSDNAQTAKRPSASSSSQSSWAPAADAAVRQIPSLLSNAALRAAGSVAGAATTAAQSAASALGSGATSAAALVPRFGAASTVALWTSAAAPSLPPLPASPMPGSLKRLATVLSSTDGTSTQTASTRRLASSGDDGSATMPAPRSSVASRLFLWVSSLPGGSSAASVAPSVVVEQPSRSVSGSITTCVSDIRTAAAGWLACAFIPAIMLTRTLACVLPCALRSCGCRGLVTAFSQQVASRLTERQLAAFVGVLCVLFLAWAYGWFQLALIPMSEDSAAMQASGLQIPHRAQTL